MNPIVFITGATSGFGRASARLFASNGYDVIVSGRRQGMLEEVMTELKAFPVRTLMLVLDVRNQKEVANAVQTLPDEWKAIDVLVNNAGLAAGKASFDEAELDDWEAMIDTNVKGLLYVSRAVIPLMISQKKGHIINIGSIAGRQVYDKGNVYCATKHAVSALSKSMRIELLPHHIKVTEIQPGAAETEFSLIRFKQDEKAAAQVYEGYAALTADDVAAQIYYVTTLPPHVCINQLEITPLAQADAYYTFKG